jgi:hypothetical protein
MKIIELLINELDKFTGVDAVALVEQPAIEADFFAFKKEVDDTEERILHGLIQLAIKEHFIDKKPGETQEEYVSRCIPVLEAEGYDKDQSQLPDYIDEVEIKKDGFESFTDYPESATNAAKRALEWRDGHPDQDCGTRVGWTRANQLANREPISEETIARMASFARHLQHEDVPYSEGCGGLMVDAWGGRAGIEWAQNKLEDIREEDSAQKFSFAIDEDQQMVVGPLMIPEKLIMRVDENKDPYYVFFSEKTIKEIAQKVMKNKLIDKLNLEHNPEKPVDGYMVSTWLVEDPLKDKQQLYGFNFVEGTWMGQYKIEDPEVWQMVKDKKIKGFSIEGFFSDKFIQAKKQN